MHRADTINNRSILISAGIVFFCWYSYCLVNHLNGLLNVSPIVGHPSSVHAASNLSVKAICLLADIAAIAGIICLKIKRRQAQPALLTALISGLAVMFYIFNFDPNFALYQVIDILKPAVSVFILLVLIWYTQIALENNWIK